MDLMRSKSAMVQTAQTTQSVQEDKNKTRIEDTFSIKDTYDVQALPAILLLSQNVILVELLILKTIALHQTCQTWKWHNNHNPFIVGPYFFLDRSKVLPRRPKNTAPPSKAASAAGTQGFAILPEKKGRQQKMQLLTMTVIPQKKTGE